jgi:hypothetical protein
MGEPPNGLLRFFLTHWSLIAKKGQRSHRTRTKTTVEVISQRETSLDFHIGEAA